MAAGVAQVADTASATSHDGVMGSRNRFEQQAGARAGWVRSMQVRRGPFWHKLAGLTALTLVAGNLLSACSVAEFYGDPAPAYRDRTGFQVDAEGKLVILTYGCQSIRPLTRVMVLREFGEPDTVMWDAAGSAAIRGRNRIEYGQAPEGLESRRSLELAPTMMFVVDLLPSTDYALSSDMRLTELPKEGSGMVVGVNNDLLTTSEFWRIAADSCR